MENSAPALEITTENPPKSKEKEKEKPPNFGEFVDCEKTLDEIDQIQ